MLDVCPLRLEVVMAELVRLCLARNKSYKLACIASLRRRNTAQRVVELVLQCVIGDDRKQCTSVLQFR